MTFNTKPLTGISNAASRNFEQLQKLAKGISGVEAAQADIGGIESAAQRLGAAYQGLQPALDQQQNAGIYEMRRLAGQQFAASAGRGGASNAMSSAGVGAANAQMSGQIGQFMGDMAAQKAQAAIAGAQSGLDTEGLLYGYRQDAAAAPVDAAQLYLEQDIGNKIREEGLNAIGNQVTEIFNMNANNAAQLLQDANAYLATLDPNERANAIDIMKKAAKARNKVLTVNQDGTITNILHED